MGIKDYKSPASTAVHPPTKKKVKSKRIDKKTTAVFIVGYLLGVLSLGVVFMNYPNNNHIDTPNVQAEQPVAVENTEEKQPPPVLTSTPEETTSDFQFYEQLSKFEFADPVQTAPDSDEFNQLLLLEKTNQATAQNREANLADKKETPNRYIIQAGTFSNEQAAQDQRRKIIDLGYKETHIFRLAYDQKKHYRVWLGPYSNLTEGTKVANALKSAHIEVMLRNTLKKFNPQEK
ncbi:MAG: SPOR domain-containing protein [Chromatiales bacterium]|nr:SPOR domain-containing protein [Chromatiales bacterium]